MFLNNIHDSNREGKRSKERAVSFMTQCYGEGRERGRENVQTQRAGGVQLAAGVLGWAAQG